MTEIRDYFPSLDALDVPALHARRDELLTLQTNYAEGATVGDYTKLLDEPLAELLAVSRALRKKAAIGTKRKSTKTKEPASLDSLA